MKSNKPKPVVSKRVILPRGATKRFQEILKEGGIITMITVDYSRPSRPGQVSWGKSFLTGQEVKGIKIE